MLTAASSFQYKVCPLMRRPALVRCCLKWKWNDLALAAAATACLLRIILRQMLCSEGSHTRLCECGKMAQLGWMDVRKRKVGGGKIDNTCKRQRWQDLVRRRQVRSHKKCPIAVIFRFGPLS